MVRMQSLARYSGSIEIRGQTELTPFVSDLPAAFVHVRIRQLTSSQKFLQVPRAWANVSDAVAVGLRGCQPRTAQTRQAQNGLGPW